MTPKDKLKGQCIEEVVGNYKTLNEVSKEYGVTPQTISKWITKHWLGSKSSEDYELRESSINKSSDNTDYQ